MAVGAGAALYPSSLLAAVYEDLLTHTYGNPHSAAAATATGLPSSAAAAAAAAGGASMSSVATAAPSFSPAAASEAVMEQAALAVLQHLHADPAEYQVVFTRWVGSVLEDD